MKFKHRTDKLSGMDVYNFRPLEQLTQHLEQEAKRVRRELKMEAKFIPIILETLVKFLTDPDANGRPVVCYRLQLIPGEKTDTELEFLFFHMDKMLEIVCGSQEYASRVNGFWVRVPIEPQQYLFIRVSDNPDTSLRELSTTDEFYSARSE